LIVLHPNLGDPSLLKSPSVSRHTRDNPAFPAGYFEESRSHDGREIKPLVWPSRFW